MTYARSRAIPYITEIFRKIEGMVLGTDPAYVITDVDDPLHVTTTFGVPSSFTQQTSSSKTSILQKGQLNHIRQRPVIINEHVETARQMHSTVTAVNTVGQIFKASQDNINSITLTLETVGGVVFDDFESYADDAALQLEWPTSGANPATLDTAIVHGGTKSMKILGKVNLESWERTVAATDFTGYTGSFNIYFIKKEDRFRIESYLSDGTYTKRLEVVQPDENEWFNFQLFEEDYIEDDPQNPVDMTAVTTVGWRVTDSDPAGVAYIDDITATPEGGSVGLELWDMGTTLPVTGVTALDDGTQYVELGDRGLNGGTVVAQVDLELLGGRRQYTAKKFIAGTALEIPSNTLLAVDNYYAIVIRYIDTEVDTYGSNESYTTDYYNNGYAFTTPDNATAITSLGVDADLQFAVFSTQDVYVNTVAKFYDATPGPKTTETVYVEDKNMKIVGIVGSESVPPSAVTVEFKDRVFWHPKGGKFEVNQNSDFDDDTTQLTVLYGYMFEPQAVNG